MSHTIRRATKRDIAKMVDISRSVHRSSTYENLIPIDHKQHFLEYYSDTEQARERLHAKFAAQFDTQDAYFFVAENGGMVVGYVGVRLDDSGVAVMKGLFVDTEQQGKGVGGDLLSQAIESAKPRAVELKVLENNMRARELYEKYGFELVGVNEDKFFGANEIVMRQSIDKN